jgi:hypothetical protein
LENNILKSHLGVFHWDTNMLGESSSVIWVDLVNVLEETFLDVSSSATKCSTQVLNESFSLRLVVNFFPKGSWLLIVGVWMR